MPDDDKRPEKVEVVNGDKNPASVKIVDTLASPLQILVNKPPTINNILEPVRVRSAMQQWEYMTADEGQLDTLGGAHWEAVGVLLTGKILLKRPK